MGLADTGAMKRRAVVVEMDDVIAGMICYFLELQGISCSPATTAEQGLDLLRTADADMAIVDASLPDHDGWWLAEAVRDRENVPRVPLLLLTGSRDNFERAERLACECLRKPFSYEELNDGLTAAARLCTSPAAFET